MRKYVKNWVKHAHIALIFSTGDGVNRNLFLHGQSVLHSIFFILIYGVQEKVSDYECNKYSLNTMSDLTHLVVTVGALDILSAVLSLLLFE